jgi:orotidine-5'-phosphate decarboxylase
VHDIPRTAAGAVAGASRLGVTFLTIHGSGGRDMIRAAVESARENGDVRVLTVTVLTSLDDASLSSIGVHASVLEQARRLGIVAAEEGSDGLVASPRELSVLRASVPNLFLATPGVRTPEDPPDDQRRVMTAGEAVLEGSDLIVVGRPVLKAPNLRFSVQRIVNEVARAGARHEARRAHDLNDSSALVDDVEFVADDRPRGV